MSVFFKLVLFSLCLGIYVKSCYGKTTHYYISPHGSDQNAGTSAGTPLKTLKKTLSTIQGLSSADTDQYYVELMSGYHDLDQTVYLHTNNIVIRSYQGQEVHLTGGSRVPASSFTHVTDHNILTALPVNARQHVRVVHLPNVGVTNYGSNGKYGFAVSRTAPLEVFFNGQALRLARWPNEGFINVVEVPDGKDGLRIRYNSTVPATWRKEDDLWVYGYWYWSWADDAIKVAHMDTGTQTITLAEHSRYGLRTGHFNDADAGYAKQGGYFRFENILSALDTPGEYYMDRTSGNLYVWMPNANGDVTSSDIVYISLIDTCIEVQQHVHDVTFSDFTIEACRYYGIHGYKVRNLQVLNMEIKNTGSAACACDGDCRNVRVSQCYVHDVDGGFWLYGGVRTTLESSGHIIEDNEIADYARVGAVDKHAVKANGVGHQIRYNAIYNGQYTGVWYQGNDIVMEWNHLHHVCMNASDCGAFHTGRDWTTRGNIIRHNIVDHNLRLVPGADVRGVMLDDQSSSTSITNNVFYDNHVHANIGGGRDNVIANNVMYNATKSSMEFDNRGTNHGNDADLIRKLSAMPYTNALWSARYPELAKMTSQTRSLPEGNQIYRNIVYNTGHIPLVNTYNAKFNQTLYNVTQIGWSMGSSDHFDTKHDDFRVRCFAADWANSVNFLQVPSPSEVGPRSTVGPAYLKRTPYRALSSPSNSACTTHAPATSSPVPAFLPDGSKVHDLFNVTTEGCWFSIDKCTDHPNAAGTYRDTYGEMHEHTGVNESACLQRAEQEWKYCGSHTNEQVAAIYGRTGATRLVGDGCYMAMWGCPKHGGPADGHIVTQGRVYRDTYAEQHLGAATDKDKCLSRAIGQWHYCGSSINHPVTSIYRPTGEIRTAGAGCWIHVEKCPSHPEMKSMFYDAWGATNYHTDESAFSCLDQAEYYWRKCGSNTSYPATAYYRPTTASRTFGN